MKREGSRNRYFVKRIPVAVKGRAVGLTLSLPVGDAVVPFVVSPTTQSIRVSLRTDDPGEVKARSVALDAYLDRVWRGLLEGPRTLTHKEAVSLAGEVYSRFTEALEEDPGDPSIWRRVLDANDSAFKGRFGKAQLYAGAEVQQRRSLEERFGPFVDLALSWKGLSVDDDSRRKVLLHVGQAMDSAAKKALRNAEGDYRPDENAARYPEWKEPSAATPPPALPLGAAKVSLKGLVEDWWREAKAGNKSVSTYESYKASVLRLAAFLEHDDALRVTAEDVVRFKDHRLASVNPRTGKPISPKTINDNDLAGLRRVFGWAVKNRKMASNPAAGLSVEYAEKERPRDPGFSDNEAQALLAAALAHRRSGKEGTKIAAGKRWVPWLCAFTGARVGEMAQLRKQDVTVERNARDGEVWWITITPEAGTVKNRRRRAVPLHPQLVELGFPAFVQSAPAGYLFLAPEDDTPERIRGAWRAAKNRLCEFARKTVTDPGVAPNHGWRHRFITLAREHEMSQELRRMITGHKGEGVDEDVYGKPAGLYREIKRLPRYKVGGQVGEGDDWA